MVQIYGEKEREHCGLEFSLYNSVSLFFCFSKACDICVILKALL